MARSRGTVLVLALPLAALAIYLLAARHVGAIELAPSDGSRSPGAWSIGALPAPGGAAPPQDDGTEPSDGARPPDTRTVGALPAPGGAAPPPPYGPPPAASSPLAEAAPPDAEPAAPAAAAPAGSPACTATLALTVDDVEFFTVGNASRIARDLAAEGLVATFFVVPMSYPLTHLDEAHRRMLLDLEEAGFELGLHGYTHLNSTGGANELAELGRNETFRRVRDGLAVLRGLGLRVRGFRAPMLYVGPHLYDALRAAGVEYDSSALDRWVGPRPYRDGNLTVVPAVVSGDRLTGCADFDAARHAALDSELWGDLREAMSRGEAYNVVLHVHQFERCGALGHVAMLAERARREGCLVESVTLGDVADRFVRGQR